MATTRLRKTFKYPSEDEASDSRDDLDEEEQEQLISSLQSQSQSSNALYTIVFTLLPLLISPLYFYHMALSGTTPARLKLLCLLSLTSLLASSFSMFFLSTLGVQETALDARARLDRRQRQTARRTFGTVFDQHNAPSGIVTRIMDRLDDIRLDLDVDGPLLQALPILNGVMCGLLAIAAWILKGQKLSGVSEFMWLYLLLPGFMFAMTTLARKSIIDEEKGLNELKGMKYNYKGA